MATNIQDYDLTGASEEELFGTGQLLHNSITKTIRNVRITTKIILKIKKPEEFADRIPRRDLPD
jgi:hypothetical protein